VIGERLCGSCACTHNHDKDVMVVRRPIGADIPLVSQGKGVYAPLMVRFTLNLGPALILMVALAIPGCAALSDDLRRAEAAYSAARYEHAMTWLVELDPSIPQMEVDERARYYFMRGMSAYRLGERREALHYLALSREIAGPEAQALRSEWRQAIERTIDEIEAESTAVNRPAEGDEEAEAEASPDT